MHITQVISHYVPAHRFGGPLQVAHGLGKALVRMGHTVSVCTTNLADEAEDLHVDTGRPVNVDGVTVHYSPTLGSRYWGFSPQLWQRANDEVARADFVLVHFHYQFANWAGATLARRHRTPYAVFAHGSFKTAAISRKGRWKKRLYLWLAEKKNLQRAKWLFFNAVEERRESLYADKGCILPNGIDLTEFEHASGPNDNNPAMSLSHRFPQIKGKLVVLFLGRIDFQGKGLDKLLPAFDRFRASHPDSHLLLAGPDERGGRAQTETLVHQLALGQHVTFAGLLKGNERIAALRGSDLFVLPSPSEGLSIALLEALYVGIPVLVTDRVGLSDQVTKTQAGVVVKCDFDSLLSGLCQMAPQQARSQFRGRAIDLIRNHYSWDAVATQLLQRVHTTNDGESAADFAPISPSFEAS